MATEKLNKLAQLADEETDIFESQIHEIQNVILKQLTNLVKQLDTDSEGNIKQTAKNFRLISAIRRINKIILNKKYRKAVGDYLSLFSKSRKIIDEHFEEMPENAI